METPRKRREKRQGNAGMNFEKRPLKGENGYLRRDRQSANHNRF
jgi:hypothetical protein